MPFFKRYPLASIITWGTTVLAVLVYLNTSGTLTGRAAQYVNVAAALLQVLLTAIAKTQVTPVANPKDNEGRPLVPLTPSRY